MAGAPPTHPTDLQGDGSVIVHPDSSSKPPPSPYPDISHRAKWSVSSYKFGFGVECLRDGDPETFWHIFLKFSLDDSYTPSTLAIRAGTGSSDLQEVKIMTFEKPEGWVEFDISSEPNDDGEGMCPVYAYVIHIIVAQNHMSGKDTHVRGLRVLGPIDDNLGTEDDAFAFKNLQYKMYETLR
ncbi:hypothetical protein D9611_001679 [Ephemerocybe angulata]|uniref:Anaphase-promoting complex subunit 10 n=1 Tax=Ephemerocybe angulata TaxID=980116 RepID=A0A8H5CID9_9AGAR|nr:hypothetical protein D9611_001679 [Tulosesus angulatus]